MITFLQSYRAIKNLAQQEGIPVQDMVEALIACWYTDQHRRHMEQVDRAVAAAKASERQQEIKPAPKKRGRPRKVQQLELEPPKGKRRSPSQAARRNISRGVTLAWARRKLEQAGIK